MSKRGVIHIMRRLGWRKEGDAWRHDVHGTLRRANRKEPWQHVARGGHVTLYDDLLEAVRTLEAKR